MTDTEYVLSSLEKHFLSQKEKKIVIYGVGPNTKSLLEEKDCSSIIGLMDESKTGRIYGKPILSIDDVIAHKADMIIIVARMINVQMIFRRIQKECALHHIPVYDITGALVTLPSETEKSFAHYQTVSKTALQQKIDRVDVVSFDVFDTLVMRKTLYPKDVFYAMEEENGSGFAKKRIDTEHSFHQKGKLPTLQEIYALLPEYELQKELDFEKKFLVQRKNMCLMLAYAREQGKEVYLVSDMYITGEMLWDILDSLGVAVEKDHVLVSTDYGVSKETGLFHVLRERVGQKKILHIGDNPSADISSAEKFGIEESFQIYMASKMLEDSYGSVLLEYEKNLPSRLVIGEFIAKQLNNPFLFSETKGKFRVDTMYDFGYSYLAPLLSRFFVWMVEKAKEEGISFILLAGRDGYLIEKMYKQGLAQGMDLPKMVYCETSRQVAVLSGIVGEEDLEYAARYPFYGSAVELLQSRFLLETEDLLEHHGELSVDYAILHQSSILKKSAEKRRCYQAYLKKLNIPKSEKIGFFDFASTGTCQKYLQTILERQLVGLYVLESMKSGYQVSAEIHSLFGTLNMFESEYHMTKDFLFLEGFMTSYSPSLWDVSEDGSPIYREELRSLEQLHQLKQVHQGILDHTAEFLILMKNWELVDLHLLDEIHHLGCGEYMIYGEPNVCGKFDDDFCGRVVEIAG